MQTIESGLKLNESIAEDLTEILTSYFSMIDFLTEYGVMPDLSAIQQDRVAQLLHNRVLLVFRYRFIADLTTAIEKTFNNFEE